MENIYKHSSFYCASFIAGTFFCRYYVFQKNWMFVATLCLASLSAPFPVTFTPLAFVCHILIILSISKVFSLLLYLF